MTTDERDRVVDRFFEGLEPPAPPPQLRSRVLAVATEEGGAEQPDPWSKIWNHRGIRWAWAAAVAGLVVGHVLISVQSNSGIGTVDPSLRAEHRVDEQLIDLLRPMRIVEDVRPIIGLFAAVEDPTEILAKGNSS